MVHCSWWAWVPAPCPQSSSLSPPWTGWCGSLGKNRHIQSLSRETIPFSDPWYHIYKQSVTEHWTIEAYRKKSFSKLFMTGKQSQLDAKYRRNCSATKTTRRTRRQRALDLYFIYEREVWGLRVKKLTSFGLHLPVSALSVSVVPKGEYFSTGCEEKGVLNI